MSIKILRSNFEAYKSLLLLFVLCAVSLAQGAGLADKLVEQARAAEKSGQIKQAIDYWQQASVEFAKEDNPRASGLALFFQGRLLSQEDRLSEANQQLEKASQLFESVGAQDGVALCQLQVGNNCLEESRLNDAAASFEKAWLASLQTDDKARMLECGDRLASCIEGRSQFGRALDIRERLVQIARESGDLKSEANHLTSIAAIAQLQRKPKRAKRYYQNAIATFEKAGATRDALETRSSLARFHLTLKEYEEASAIYEDLSQRELPERLRQVVLANGAYALQKAGKLERSLSLYRDALGVLKSSDLHAVKGQILDVLVELGRRGEAVAEVPKLYPGEDWLALRGRAELYQGIQERRLAEETWGALLKVCPAEQRASLTNQWATLLLRWERNADSQVVLEQLLSQTGLDSELRYSALNNLGECHFRLGRYPKAIELFKESAQSKKNGTRFVALNNLAALYQEQGRYQKAIEIYLENLATVEPGPKRSSRVGTLKNALGLAYVKLGREDEGMRAYREALQLRRITNDLRGELVTRTNMAVISEPAQARTEYEACLGLAKALKDVGMQSTLCNNLGLLLQKEDPAQALSYFEEALRLARQNSDSFSEAITLNNKAELLGEMNQPEQRLALLLESKAIFEKLGARNELLGCQQSLANCYAERGERQKALVELESCFDLIEEGILGFTNSSAVSYTTRHRSVYFKAFTLQLKEEDLAAAFRVEELSRSSALLAISRGHQVYENLPLNLRRELEGLERSIALLLNKPRSGAENRRLKGLKLDLSRAIERADSIKVGFGGFRPSEVSEVATIQKELAEDEVLVEFLFLADGLFAFVVTSDDLKFEHFDKDQNIRDSLKLLKEILSESSYTNYQSPLAIVSESIAHQLEPHLKGKRHIIAVTDGVLHTFPLGALQTSSGESLVDLYTMEFAPSSNTWLAARKRSSKRSAQQRAFVAALGNHKPSGIEVGVSSGLRESLRSPLPATLSEIDSVARFLQRPLSLKEGELTKQKILDSVEGRSVLHFATHGFLDEKFPLLSGLVTADGVLTASEILKWKLDADLVVLSACNTGNQSRDGLGLVGLTAAFQQAGARSVVASLWPVSDDSTAKWMDYFYEELGSGKSLPESWALASRRLKRDYPHPHHWAPFITQGSLPD